ncbi:MAG TPA: lysophospholipid acyltransferase family protein, partial [Pyrinomonadaceae bacterium]|nr:lysophospholipid acyltransferase family protein [Pyrinomonadaceae bacterium]
MNERNGPADEGREAESTTGRATSISGRLAYGWALLMAGLLLIFPGVPAILVEWATRRFKVVYPVASFGARVWLRLIGVRVTVKGHENLLPDRAYVLISNHRSYLDPPALLTSLKKRLGFIAKKELLRVPVLGQGMRYVNAIAIDRSNRTRAIQTMQEAAEKLRSGISFVVFAEGTRARPGQLLPFKKGGFYMALETGAAIVPVAIKNTDVLMGKGRGEA